MDTPLNGVTELVLDGQQRLTSLLHALYGIPERRYFIKVEDLSAESLAVQDVICYSKSSSTGKTSKGLDEPRSAFEQNLIPIDILHRTGLPSGTLSPLASWCIRVGESIEGMEGDEARLLEDRIHDLIDRCLFQRELWYCILPASTGPDEAADIFVATNTSSVKIKRFDIEVAKARGRHNEDVRSEIQDAYDKSDVLRYYFSDDPEDYIQDIGEWMLKVACLHIDKPPKESNYPKAMKHLLGIDGRLTPTAKQRRRQSLLDDLDWALKQAETFGAATEKMVPSWPVLHVLAALRSKMQSIGDPARANDARKLLRAYYWRCLFSSRHAVQANDRLYTDYEQLSLALQITSGELPRITAFDDGDHRPYGKTYLLRHAGWIGSARLGKALVSAVLASDPTPREWMTGASLTPIVIRELQSLRKLDRHHVFPRAALAEGRVKDELIQHGLNGVVLDRRTNLRLWKIQPSKYLRRILDEVSISDSKLKERVESHLVPYEELKREQGTIGQRYSRFRERRAELLAARIKELTTLP